LNSDWYYNNRYYNVPPLLLSQRDGDYASDFVTTINTPTTNVDSTISGSDGVITSEVLTYAMNGFEQQTITLSTSGGLLDGYFTLSLKSVSTPLIAANATTDVIKTALQSIPNIGEIIVRRRDVIDVGHSLQIFVVFLEIFNDVEILKMDYSKVRSTNSSSSIAVAYDESGQGKSPIMESKYFRSVIVNVSSDAAIVNYSIQDVYEGLDYHVRVSAWNGVGNQYGGLKGSTPALVSPLKKPSEVRDLTISQIDPQTLNVSWAVPSDFGGPYLSEYYLYEN
jgi:hypothetical protein